MRIVRKADNPLRGAAARKLFSGAVVAVARHGAETTLLPKKECDRLAVAQLRAMGTFAPGMSAAMAYACMGIDNIGHVLYLAPTLRYAREWWLTTHPAA